MKKLLVILLAAALTLTVSQAHSQIDLVSQYGKKIDTVSNVLGTKYLTSGKFDGLYESVCIYIDITEISGTTGGTLSVEVSGNGTTWAPYYNSKDSVYTFTPADVASQSFRFQLLKFGDGYIRIKFAPTGTMSDKISSYFIARK
jgi:hypothetical protein